MLINEKQDQAEQILHSSSMSHGFGQVNRYADSQLVPWWQEQRCFSKLKFTGLLTTRRGCQPEKILLKLLLSNKFVFAVGGFDTQLLYCHLRPGSILSDSLINISLVLVCKFPCMAHILAYTLNWFSCLQFCISPFVTKLKRFRGRYKNPKSLPTHFHEQVYLAVS
jgi:hypothetical protein